MSGPSKDRKAADRKEGGFTHLDRLPIGLAVLSRDGTVVHINPTLSDLLGTDKGDMVGRRVFDMMEASEIQGLLTSIRSLRGRRTMTYRLHLGPGGGAKMAFEARISELEGSGGLILASLTGLPVQTEAGAVPWRSLESLPYPIAVINRHFEPSFTNTAAEEQIILTARKRDPLRYPPKELKALLVHCFSEGKGGSVPVDLRMEDEVRAFDVSVAPIVHPDKVESIIEIWIERPTSVAAGQDKTKVRGLGDELIETSNAIIIGIDMEGHIKLFNNGAKRALGYSFEELEGKIWFDLLLDSDARKGRIEVFQWTIGTGPRTQYESRVRSRSGKAMTISLENTVIFDRKGYISMVLMVGQDITRMKKLEESLTEQKEKLVEAIEELTLYADLLLHDISNANAGIMGYLDLLEMGKVTHEHQKEYIARASSEVKKSTSIIKDVKVMTLTRPPSEASAVGLEEMLVRSVQRVRDGWGKDAPMFDLGECDFHIMGDRLLEEAFARLFENSMGCGKGRTRISIDARRDPGRGNVIPEPVHITIRDDSGEISEEAMESLLSKPRSTQWGSSTLGLYLVKRIISRYNGLVWMEKVEKGREVHILLSEAV